MKPIGLYIMAAAIATLWLYGCENTPEEIMASSQKLSQVDEATRVEAYLSQGGAVKAKLTSPVMLRVSADTSYTEFPKTLHVDFYSDNKTVETRLDARYGKYFESLGKVYLKDSVTVTTTKGDTLFCQDLWWDQQLDSFYTNKPAQQRSPGQVINGKNGLNATSPTKNFNITFKNADAVLPTKEGDLPRQP